VKYFVNYLIRNEQQNDRCLVKLEHQQHDFDLINLFFSFTEFTFI